MFIPLAMSPSVIVPSAAPATLPTPPESCTPPRAIAGIYLTGRIASADPTMGQPFGLDSVTAIAPDSEHSM